MGANDKLKVLLVVGSMNRGGAETWLMNVLRNVDRDRFQLDFLVHVEEPSTYDEEIRSLGSQIIKCLNYRNPLAYASNFKRVYREHGPYDVVHSHLFLFDGQVLRLADAAGASQRISHLHLQFDIKDGLLRRQYRRLMRTWISRHATAIIAASHAGLEEFKSECDCSNLNQILIPPVVDLEPFNRPVDRQQVRKEHRLPLDKAVIVYVARFVSRKNHEQMVRIADAMNCNGIKAHFVMIGWGELLNKYQEIASQREDLSVFTDLVDNTDILLASDLFFFPSTNEGFGIVAIEAAAAGLPVVATDLPATRESVCPEQRRYLFPVNNDNIALANLESLLKKDIHERAALEAKQWAKSFSVHSMVNRLCSFYSGVGQGQK